MHIIKVTVRTSQKLSSGDFHLERNVAKTDQEYKLSLKACK